VLHATSVPASWKRVVADTTRYRVPRPLLVPLARLNGLKYVRFFLGDEYERLSYVLDWREAWESDPALDADLCDVNDALAMARARRRMRSYDLVVVLHSAAGDSLARVRTLAPALQRRSCPLVVFFGNEYIRMAEKAGFATEVGAEFIASQLPPEPARWLYAACQGSRVLHTPPALNPRIYRPLGLPRTTDLGFRGDIYQDAMAIGDIDRTAVLELFKSRAADLGLTVDIEYDRVGREDWNLLLNRWHGVVGAESGAQYLERDDTTRAAVVAYVGEHPDARWEDVHARFFADRPPGLSGKAISSRHFEPAGAGTCQVLVEGRYNDILVAGEHYIRLRRDHSNLGEVVAAFKDVTHRRAIVDRCRELVLGSHTYRHRVRAVLKDVLGA